MNNRVIIDAAICHGKPVIRGTRVPVTTIVGALAAGMSFDEIIAEYEVAREDIQAALSFANHLVEGEQFHPLPTV